MVDILLISFFWKFTNLLAFNFTSKFYSSTKDTKYGWALEPSWIN